MSRLSVSLVLGLALVGAGCKDSPTEPPPPAIPTFTFGLTSANEVPPVSNSEAGASGTVTIRLNITRDAAGAITAATVDFQCSLSGFPATTNITAAHIHEAPAGSNAGVRVNTGLASGEVALVGGSGTFTKNAVNVTDVAIIQRILDNPSGFYFNVHSTANGGGVVRGQLVRTQ